jgi:hypothetical protein
MTKQTSLQDDLSVTPVGEKVLNPKVVEGSVIDTPSYQENRGPGSPLMFAVASVADLITPWGRNVASRDKQLRDFFITEPLMASAVYSTSARNSSFAWEIVAANPRNNPRYTIDAVTRLLKGAAFGKGWGKLMMKTSLDIYTQDNAAFWEIVRIDNNNPLSPTIGINNLDSARCTRTGDPAVPVLYQDRRGRYHALKAHQVVTLEEQPSTIEDMYDVQYCAVSRALRLSQIARSIFIYKDEKVSGRNPRAVDFVSGVSETQIRDAIKMAASTADNAGFLRYASNVLVPGIDPNAQVSHARVDLASLPDNFDFDSEMKWYVSILAMAFGVDYQEFAPLPSGAMGSGAQSEILHLKTHGKGPATIMALIEHIINNSGIIPATVKFQFLDHDAQAEKQKAESAYTRARDRSLRLSSGELDSIAARQIAIQDGDLPEWVAEGMEERDAGDIAAPIEEPSQTPPNEMQNSPDQIEGAQQQQLQGRKWISGGMRGVKPKTEPPEIDDGAVEAERKQLLGRLSHG